MNVIGINADLKLQARKRRFSKRRLSLQIQNEKSGETIAPPESGVAAGQEAPAPRTRKPQAVEETNDGANAKDVGTESDKMKTSGTTGDIYQKAGISANQGKRESTGSGRFYPD